MKSQDRAAALVALIDADRDERAHAIEEPAQRQAREALAQARRAARSRVSTAIAEERAALAARVASAQAGLATTRRMTRQHRIKALVAAGWERLPRSLVSRWAEAGAREAWTRAAIDHAAAILPPAPWTLEAPGSWSEAEREVARTQLAARGVEARFSTVDGIEAGLRLTCGNVEVDATLAGLLADRAAVEGRLLHFLDEEAER